MKHFLFLFIIFFSFEKAKSAEYNGYYVTNKNDTIYTKIYAPSLIFFGNDIFHKVEVLDTTTSKKLTLKPGDISCFVYFDGGKKFVYVSKAFDGQLLFFERRIRNSNYSLFSCYYTLDAGQSSIGKIKLIIAKNDSLYISINSEVNSNKTREKLKGFFTEPNIQQKIEEIFRYRATTEKDAINFVNYLNKEYLKE
jgi:hypothetical protein